MQPDLQRVRYLNVVFPWQNAAPKLHHFCSECQRTHTPLKWDRLPSDRRNILSKPPFPYGSFVDQQQQQ